MPTDPRRMSYGELLAEGINPATLLPIVIKEDVEAAGPITGLPLPRTNQ